MADILQTLAAGAARRVAAAKERVPLAKMIARAEALPADTGFPFEAALAGPELAFICEVKKASPSKGLIAPVFPYRRGLRSGGSRGHLLFDRAGLFFGQR